MHVFVINSITGSMYLEWQGIHSGSSWDLWQNMFALAVIATGFFIIGYVALRRQTRLH
jgi:hypothetical protein